ncbi:MAG: amidohydrolase [Nocardioidaceae bacterium]
MAAPDLLFTGGSVFRPDAPPIEAVAVTGGRIVAVGGNDLRALAGPRTRVVDLAGGLLVPGFVDAHVHPVQGGLERMRCDLSATSGRAGCLAAVAAYARTQPDIEWVTGGGWCIADFDGGTPLAADLDRVVGHRPAFLLNRDHHGAWVNSAALRRAAIDADTPDPADGRIERGADGHPSGTLHEGAMALVARLVPAATPDDQVAALLEAQSHLHSFGITGWQDAIIGEYATITDSSSAYLRLANDGRLTARVVGALWWDRERGTEQVTELVTRRSALRAGRFRATSVKIMQDGIAENFTAGMVEPYLDRCGCPTANRGLSFVDPTALAAAVTALDAKAFQVHVHAIGDRAVRETLDAFAAARTANGIGDGWLDHRHHIAHLQVVQPDDVPRFAELGVAATVQPLWAAHEPQMDELTIPFLGAERVAWQYPFRDLQRAGARLAAGSDWPVSSADPLAGIHVAVNRRLPDASAGTPAFLPGQAIDLSSALEAYTRGSAYLNGDDAGGRIALGAPADLTVLDRNPFAGPPEEIGDTSVVATYVDGVEVFSC